MAPQLPFLIVIGLVALAGGIALAQLIQWPRTHDPSVASINRLQRAVRRFGILLGAIEIAALIVLVVMLFRVPPGSTEMWLLGGAAVCVAAMMVVWVAWLKPLDTVIATWAPDAVPVDWPRHHLRWSTSHRIRVVLAVIAIALLLMGIFARPAH